MDINWIKIISYILTIALGALSLYFKHSAAAQSKAANIEAWVTAIKDDAKAYIVRAEKEFEGTQRGGEKFEWVVNYLHASLPEWVRAYITKELIADIVQKTFDAMADYATTQLDKVISEKEA